MLPGEPYYNSYQSQLSENLNHYLSNRYFNSLPSLPRIMAVGYLDTSLNNINGGSLKIIAQFNIDEVDEISSVEIYSNNVPLVSLNNSGMNGDFVPQDEYFTFVHQFDGALPAGDYLFDFMGVTKDGKQTEVAPYLILK
jgi:hypothetical protein